MTEPTASCGGLNSGNSGSGSSSTIFPGKFSTVRPMWELSTSSDMCRMDDADDFPVVGSVS